MTFSFTWECVYVLAGVDSSVKVVYKPVRRFREESGIISKTVTYTYKQVTELVNTRSEPAVITFVDQVPKSQDEKLKVWFRSLLSIRRSSFLNCDMSWLVQVTLTEPVIAKQKQNAPPPNPKLNAQNNIEWRLELKPEESRSITVQYTVEFPTNKEVEGLWTNYVWSIRNAVIIIVPSVLNPSLKII